MPQGYVCVRHVEVRASIVAILEFLRDKDRYGDSAG